VFTTEGFLAFADIHAGRSFRTASYFPAETATQFAVLALEDNTTVTIDYAATAFQNPDLEVSSLSTPI